MAAILAIYNINKFQINLNLNNNYNNLISNYNNNNNNIFNCRKARLNLKNNFNNTSLMKVNHLLLVK